METNFNFKSQICTDKNQSERLLALGLKKETADIVHYFSQCLTEDWTIVPLVDGETARYIQGLEIPAWSLHRLLSLIPSSVGEFNIEMNGVYSIGYTNLIIFCKGYLYDNIIDCIEWLIKEKCFPKEYLI